jgi:hypothetical protein
MSKSVVTETQSHITVLLPVKDEHFNTVEQILQSAGPQMIAAADAMGTVHFARFVRLSDSTLAFVSEFDGSFVDYLEGFLKHLGPLFDQILPHIVDPPPTPVASNADAFISWVEKHNRPSLAFYSGYPTMHVQEIRSRAGLKGASAGKGVQNVLAEVFPLKSILHYMELRFLLPRLLPSMTKSSDEIGTLHFANFVDLGNAQIGFFTIYDGDFRSYMNDFMKFIGPTFDELMKHMKNPCPTPVAKNPEEFIAWAEAIQHDPIVFYSAYPTLGVQDVKALPVAA